MPKLTGPLFSLTATGTLNGVLTYFRSKGMDEVRANVHHFDPNTILMQTARSYFSNAVTAWKALTAPNKTAWDTYADSKGNPAVSGFNWFVGKYCDYLNDHAGVEPTAPFLPA